MKAFALVMLGLSASLVVLWLFDWFLNWLQRHPLVPQVPNDYLDEFDPDATWIDEDE